MADRLEHWFTTDDAGRLTSCACGHEGDLFQHARRTLVRITCRGEVRPPIHLRILPDEPTESGS